MKKQLTDIVKRDRKSTSDGNYAKIIMNDQGVCPLVDEQGLCNIHKNLGESYLCNTCAIYSRIYSNVGGIIEKSLSLSCPEVMRIVLDNREGIGFIEDVEEVKALMNKSLSLEEYPYFWDLRIYIIQLLQDRSQSIEIRLIILGLFLQRINKILVREYSEQLPIIMQDYIDRLGNKEFINSLDNISSRSDFLIYIMKNLLLTRAKSVKSNKYKELVTQVIDGLKLDNTNEEYYEEIHNLYYKKFMKDHEYIIENYLVNYVFKNLFPYDEQDFQQSYLMLVIHIMLIKAHVTGLAAYKRYISKNDVFHCIQQIGRTVEHNQLYLNWIKTEMTTAGYTTMGHMFSLLK